MISRRMLLLSLTALGATACSRKDSSPAQPAGSVATNGVLDPSDSVDPAFQGCAKSCGSRSAKDRSAARAQPGAVAGDAVFCPVSGAVFRINDVTPHRESQGKTLYFCCESCSAFFVEHEAEVRAKRGIS